MRAATEEIKHHRTAGAAAALGHASRGLARAKECAEHVDVEDKPHALGAHVDEARSRRCDAGVDDDAVEGPERVRRRVEHGDDVALARDVSRERDGLGAQTLRLDNGRLRRRAVLHIIDADRPAALGREQ